MDSMLGKLEIENLCKMAFSGDEENVRLAYLFYKGNRKQHSEIKEALRREYICLKKRLPLLQARYDRIENYEDSNHIFSFIYRDPDDYNYKKRNIKKKYVIPHFDKKYGVTREKTSNQIAKCRKDTWDKIQKDLDRIDCQITDIEAYLELFRKIFIKVGFKYHYLYKRRLKAIIDKGNQRWHRKAQKIHKFFKP